MADIFREIDEEVRRERLKQLWDRYSAIIVALAVLVIAGVGGWRGYEWWQAKQASEAGAIFESAVVLSEQGKHEEAYAAFAAIAERGGAYRVLARLRAAAELARKDRDGAVKIYDEVAGDAAAPQTLRELANVRAGLLLVDSAGYEAMEQRLEPLTSENGTFRHTARELLALTAWRTGDSAKTKHWVDAIMNDAATPPGTRARTEMLLALSGASAKG